MARTLDTSLTIPTVQALAGAEVATGLASPSQGWEAVCRAANTAYVHQSHQLLAQPAGGSVAIVDAVGEVALWRVGAFGAGSALTVSWTVGVLRASSGTTVIRVGEVGGSYTDISVTGASASPSYHVVTHTVADASDSVDLYMEAISSTHSSFSVVSASCAYTRLRSLYSYALPSGVGDDGVAPIDLAHVGDGYPMSTQRARDVLEMVRRTYARGGSAVATASGAAFTPSSWLLQRPSTPDGQDLQLTVDVYSTTAAGTYSVTTSTPWGDCVILTSGIGWYSGTIDIPTPRDGTPVPPDPVTVTLGSGAAVKSYCATWEAITL